MTPRNMRALKKAAVLYALSVYPIVSILSAQAMTSPKDPLPFALVLSFAAFFTAAAHFFGAVIVFGIYQGVRLLIVDDATEG